MGTGKGATKANLEKLKKLCASDDIEHFLETFQHTPKQRERPKDVWAMQFMGLLTGQPMQI